MNCTNSSKSRSKHRQYGLSCGCKGIQNIIIIIIIIINAVELSLGGSSPYTGTHKTNKNKYI